MKIRTAQIPAEKLTFEEELSASALDLETEGVKFRGPIHIKADIIRITNVVSADVVLKTVIGFVCSRCLNEFEIVLDKKVKFNYPVSKNEETIDLDQDIKEEIFLDYPLQPLCAASCKGLCSKCGKNLNEGGCSCASSEKKTL